MIVVKCNGAKLKIYDSDKYTTKAKKMGEIIIEDFAGFEVVNLANYLPKDPHDEYLRVHRFGGRIETYRNSFVDLFIF